MNAILLMIGFGVVYAVVMLLVDYIAWRNLCIKSSICMVHSEWNEQPDETSAFVLKPDHYYEGHELHIISGKGAGQFRTIINTDNSIKTFRDYLFLSWRSSLNAWCLLMVITGLVGLYLIGVSR